MTSVIKIFHKMKILHQDMFPFYTYITSNYNNLFLNSRWQYSSQYTYTKEMC